MVKSYFPGRIRLRSPIFKDDDISLLLVSILKKHKAVKNLSHNKVTGSVLLDYNEEKIPVEKLESLKKEPNFNLSFTHL